MEVSIIRQRHEGIRLGGERVADMHFGRVTGSPELSKVRKSLVVV